MRFRSTSWKYVSGLPAGASFDDLARFFSTEPDATLCPVLDARDRPVGYVPRPLFQRLISSPYGHALNHKKTVADLMKPDPFIARLSDDPATVFRDVLDKSDLLTNGLILIHEDGTYFGCLNALGVFHALSSIHAGMLKDLESQIAERERAERKVRLLADTDSLTQILNRRAFIRHLDDRVATNRHFVCVFVDLDRFKPLNDRYGHAVGDAVLKAIAKRLAAEEDCQLACRLGGDEFAFVLEADTPARTMEAAERVHGAITAPIKLEAGLVSVGASMGMAAYPRDAEDVSVLMHAADKAMIRCKADGGGAACFDRSLDFLHLDAESLDAALISAVREGNFRPAVQPILDTRSRDVVGYEVLARWPDSGLAKDPSPAQFIPMIERLGLLDGFFWSLINQALRWMPPGDTFLSLNVSPSQVSSAEFASRLLQTLSRHRIAPERIELEITEHVLFRNIDASKRVLNEIVSHGISLALDDFGTGYSALSLLEELPFRKVKLDKSLLGKGTGENGLPKVLAGSLKMCQELGLVSCAEGVETGDQLEQLSLQECDLAQGYLIGRPAICGHGQYIPPVARAG